MNLIEIILVSIALASDAFAIAVCKSLSFNNTNIKNCFKLAISFGIFQGIMPLIGYIFAGIFNNVIKIDHYISFIILLYIGIKMIKESFDKTTLDNDLSFKSIIILSIATSIDALCFGIAYSYAYNNTNLYIFLIIGIITFILSLIGAFIGNKIGHKYEKHSRILGGTLLIIMAFKILLEHTL